MGTKTDIQMGKALITGASAGIGAVYADRLAKRGYDLILVARDEAKMSELAQRIQKVTSRKVEVFPADLTSKSDLLRVENLLKSDPNIALIVNNAGIATATPFIDTPVDAVETLIDLNVMALTRLTSAAAPVFAKRGHGIIVNIASVVALSPGRLSAVYSASKAFVLNLTQALHEELASKGVQVQAVLPGATRTEIWAKGGIDVGAMPKEIVMSAEDMVDASLVALDKKEAVTIPSLPNVSDWNEFENARKALGPNLSHAKPAARYAH